MTTDERKRIRRITQKQFSSYLLKKKIKFEKERDTCKYQIIDLPKSWVSLDFDKTFVSYISDTPFSSETLKALDIGGIVRAYGIYWLIRGNIK